MRRHCFIFIAFAALALLSCTREELPEQSQKDEDVEVESENNPFAALKDMFK